MFTRAYANIYIYIHTYLYILIFRLHIITCVCVYVWRVYMCVYIYVGAYLNELCYLQACKSHALGKILVSHSEQKRIRLFLSLEQVLRNMTDGEISIGKYQISRSKTDIILCRSRNQSSPYLIVYT